MDNFEVTISREEYDILLENQKWIDALEAAGVDNWDGIDFALEILRENNPHD